MHPDNRDGLQQLIGSDYRLQWIIGHGGMSTVWLADDTRFDREVAIKVLKPEFSSHDEFLTRFRNEAKAAEGIDSANVVQTYDYREVEADAGYTVCFIVMEYIRGESLADMLAREGKLEEPLALEVLDQAAHGLAVIHRMGLVHRDIKPGNIMITQNGKAKITDFGIAKAAAAVPLTRTGMVVGTAQYVSPEQAQGREVTAASDVYSLGVVGYEMLAGNRPFSGDSSVSVALAHVNNEPPALSTGTSAPARELIGIALRKDPATRFADGNELALAVAAVREGNRPPQPASAAMAQVAEKPSSTASTRQLAAVAQPTTLHPEVRRQAPAGLVERKPAAAKTPVRHDDDNGSSATWIVVGLLVLAAVGALIWAFVSGPFSAGGRGEETTGTSVITEYVTPTEDTDDSDTSEPTAGRQDSSEPRRQPIQRPSGPRPADRTVDEPAQQPDDRREAPNEPGGRDTERGNPQPPLVTEPLPTQQVPAPLQPAQPDPPQLTSVPQAPTQQAPAEQVPSQAIQNNGGIGEGRNPNAGNGIMQGLENMGGV
ncbi:serine/threonine-protein kinase [Corynebacterium cystitidis]|uniref:serine/threonine-protein kinase n=1 Tax=Corynebacterium cystitidis TaxID=35757 RepID=UPI00211F10BF|nr:serine/threonine protein kinase [Corynebacterium cystitidis]